MTDDNFNRGDGSTVGSTSDPFRHNQTGASAAGSTAGDLGGKVKEDMASVRQKAAEQVSNASAKAEKAADQQKNYMAKKVAGIASVIEKVGSDLEGQDDQELGRVTRQLGESVHRFAGEIEGRSLGDIAAMAEDFGRKQPMAFLGIAAIAGLAASRFIGASASRQPATSSSRSGATGSSGYGTSSTAGQNSPAGALRSAPAATPNPRPSVSTAQTMPGTGTFTGGSNG